MYGITKVTPAVYGCHGNFLFYRCLHFDHHRKTLKYVNTATLRDVIYRHQHFHDRALAFSNCLYSVTYTSLGYPAFRHTACIVWGHLKQNDFISAKTILASWLYCTHFFPPSQINSDAWSSFLILLCSRCQY